MPPLAARARGVPGPARARDRRSRCRRHAGSRPRRSSGCSSTPIPVYSVLANALAAPVVGGLLGLALVAGLLAPVAPSAALRARVGRRVARRVPDRVREGRRGACRSRSSRPRRRSSRLVVAALSVVVFARLRAPRPLRALVLLAMCSLALVAWVARAGTGPASAARGASRHVPRRGAGRRLPASRRRACRLLVDQGPPDARVADQLRRLGVRRLTALVLTHPQRDHVGGAAEVLAQAARRLRPRPATRHDGPRRAGSDARGPPPPRARRGRARRTRASASGGSGSAVLWPDGPGFPGEDPNLRATILLVSYGQVDLLLTADAESPVTLPLDPPPVEILKVAHHGSADDGPRRSSSSACDPKIAVISVGLGNDYGHPTPSTLWALEHAPGLRLYRTDLDGRVVVESDGTRLWVRYGALSSACTVSRGRRAQAALPPDRLRPAEDRARAAPAPRPLRRRRRRAARRARHLRRRRCRCVELARPLRHRAARRRRGSRAVEGRGREGASPRTPPIRLPESCSRSSRASSARTPRS